MTIQRATILLPAAAVLLAACGAGEPERPRTEMRDSAGITVVENEGRDWSEGHAWRLTEAPTIDIGMLEGPPEYQLYLVAGVRRLSDGRIVVANGGTNELRFYDADGRYISSVGREGEGPGEFERLRWLGGLPGDSILAFDRGTQRLSVFDAEGTFVRSFRFENLGEELSSPRPAGQLGDGSLVVRLGRVFIAGDVEDGVSRDSIVFLHYDLEGALQDTIGRFPGSDAFVQTRDRSFAVIPLAFGRSPGTATHEQWFYYGASDTYEIGLYSPAGALERLVRKRHTNLAVTTEDVERYKQDRLESASDDNRRRRLERMIADMPVPETMPAYSGLKVDAEGNLWVEVYRRPGDDRPRWNVFDPEGRMLGTVETPERFNIHQIGSDFVLGRWTDEFDVEHVRAYGLVKPAGEMARSGGAPDAAGG